MAPDQTYRVNLALGALIKAGCLLALVQGVVSSIFLAVWMLASGDTENLWYNVIFAPIYLAIVGAVLSLAAYPIIKLWCGRFGYPRLWGEFTQVEK